MDEIFLKKDNLPDWLARQFKKELISIDDLIELIDELSYENQELKYELKEEEISNFYGMTDHDDYAYERNNGN